MVFFLWKADENCFLYNIPGLELIFSWAFRPDNGINSTPPAGIIFSPLSVVII
jgi:hypothetical protein